MGWREGPVRFHPLPLGAAAVLFAGAALILPCVAAEHDLHYSASVGEMYTQDVYRTGDETEDDYLTTLRFTSGLKAATPRSLTILEYTPQFFKYAEFGELDHLDHRLRTTWRFTPGQRSTVGFRQGFTYSERQAGFRDFRDGGGGATESVLPKTRFVVWDLEPYHRIEVTRDWSLETSAIFRSQEFDYVAPPPELAGSELVDSTLVGVRGAASVRVGRSQRVGGEVRYDLFNFDGEDVEGQLDRFQAAELLWARVGGGIFAWRGTAGLFRATDGGSHSVTEPTAALSASWGFERSRLTLGYYLGYSSAGGYGEVRRDEWIDLDLTRTWGKAFETTFSGSYVEREELQDEDSDASWDLEGYQFDLLATYIWPTRLGVSVRLTALRQDETTGRDLDYWEGSVALTYRSAERRRAPAASSESGS